MITSSVTNHISEGLTNVNDSASFTWFKTNFNMPVPDIFTFDPSTFSPTDGFFTYIGESNSYDLSGFEPGFEVCVATAVYFYENTSGSSKNLDSLEYIRFTNPDYSSFNPVSETLHRSTYTLPDGTWAATVLCRNVGVAGWEINTDDTYHFLSNAVGLNGDTPNIATSDSDIEITNCPSTAKITSVGDHDYAVGNMWVEGNDLCYVNCGGWSPPDGGWKSTIVGSDISSSPGTDKAGCIWLDGSDIHWIGSDGHEYIPTWKVEQFASSFSGGPTSSKYAGTSKAGCMWMDSEFGCTHLAYIAENGYKFLTGSGVDPY